MKPKYAKAIVITLAFLIVIPLGRYLYHEWRAKKSQPYVRLERIVSRIAAKCPSKLDEYTQLQRLELLPNAVIRAEYRLLQVLAVDIPAHEIPALMAEAKKDAVDRFKRLLAVDALSEIDVVVLEVYTDKEGRKIFENETRILRMK